MVPDPNPDLDLDLDLDLDPSPAQTAYLIYDGDCPFCSHYVAEILAFRAEHGALELVSARSKHPLVSRYASEYNLDQGFLFLYQDHIYYGSDAIFLLTTLSSKRTISQRLLGYIFGNKKLAQTLYPVLAWLRRCYFRILGKPLIRGGPEDKS